MTDQTAPRCQGRVYHPGSFRDVRCSNPAKWRVVRAGHFGVGGIREDLCGVHVRRWRNMNRATVEPLHEPA